VELEGRQSGHQPGSLIMAGIPFVFTIARVAAMLGEDEDWLFELSMRLDPEDGCLWVLDINDREVQAFTQYGIECLQQLVVDERAAGTAPKSRKPSSACGAHRMLTVGLARWQVLRHVLLLSVRA
jgi:predicted ATP-grasp superfamily ATP-dependent carboligase